MRSIPASTCARSGRSSRSPTAARSASAATRLGYSQSAISHRIAALERSLGAPLFARPGGRGAVSLTAAGQAAYAHARRAIAAVEALEAEVGAGAADGRATLRVGVFQTAAAELLPPALRAFRREWPRVEVILSENDKLDRISDQLSRGRLDLAFARDATSDDRVDAIPLMDDPLVILTRRDSPLVTLKAPTFDVLDGAEVVAWTRRWPLQLELEAAWRRRAISPRVVFRTEDNLALQRLVAAGLGDACIGRVAAQHAIDPRAHLGRAGRVAHRPPDRPARAAPPRADRRRAHAHRDDQGPPPWLSGASASRRSTTSARPRRSSASGLAPTPLVSAPALGPGVLLKVETVQPTGSFKVRGALAAVAHARPGEHVVTVSAGNHGLGVAQAAALLGRSATVVVPENASRAKVDRLRSFPVDLVLAGDGYDAAEAHALDLARGGGVFVSPYNDPHVIAGQRTVAVEIGASLDGPLTIVVPVGGGGLVAGVALWAAGRDDVRVVGVEAAASRAMSAAVRAGRVVDVPIGATLADGMAGQRRGGERHGRRSPPGTSTPGSRWTRTSCAPRCASWRSTRGSWPRARAPPRPRPSSPAASPTSGPARGSSRS